eukprot:COSAG04_NODE_4856_length_1859_cov_1.660227_3_plen_221_part_00
MSTAARPAAGGAPDQGGAYAAAGADGSIVRDEESGAEGGSDAQAVGRESVAAGGGVPAGVGGGKQKEDSAAKVEETAALRPADRGEAGGKAEDDENDEEEEKTVSCCKRCLFWLQNRRIRGYTTGAFLGIMGQLALPELDAVSDALVTIKFYMDGDMHWFEASLTILLVSGVVATIKKTVLRWGGAGRGGLPRRLPRDAAAARQAVEREAGAAGCARRGV